MQNTPVSCEALLMSVGNYDVSETIERDLRAPALTSITGMRPGRETALTSQNPAGDNHDEIIQNTCIRTTSACIA